MATFEKTEFEFPDEKENPRKGGKVVTPEADDDIEIVDDTPEEVKAHGKMDDPPEDASEDAPWPARLAASICLTRMSTTFFSILNGRADEPDMVFILSTIALSSFEPADTSTPAIR